MSRIFTTEEKQAIAKDYPTTRTETLAAQYGCSTRLIYSVAYSQGAKKTAAYIEAERAERMKQNSGKESRFKPGCRPHNAGKKGWAPGGNAKATQFKKGCRPASWRPIGSTRVGTDGIMQCKMTDTGRARRDWRNVHVMLWEEINGPVKPGHIVVFKNRDPSDVRVDNLEHISRKENMIRNTIHRYPPELRRVIKIHSAIKRKISEVENANN